MFYIDVTIYLVYILYMVNEQLSENHFSWFMKQNYTIYKFPLLSASFICGKWRAMNILHFIFCANNPFWPCMLLLFPADFSACSLPKYGFKPCGYLLITPSEGQI